MTKPSRATPARMQTAPETMAIIPARATARLASPAASGATTPRMIAASEEFGPEHQDAARTEQRVSEQGDDGRIEATGAGEAGGDGVCDSDRRKRGREHKPRSEIANEPTRFIAFAASRFLAACGSSPPLSSFQAEPCPFVWPTLTFAPAVGVAVADEPPQYEGDRLRGSRFRH